MITLFGQNRILTIKITILQLISPISLQAAPLSSMAEPSNFAPGSSDRHAQLLAVGTSKEFETWTEF